MICRHCGTSNLASFIDLRLSPPSNSYIHVGASSEEVSFPLRVVVCKSCWLVQTEDFTSAESLFTEDYAYFSSFSSSWLTHSESLAELLISRYSLDQTSLVAEIASNDGYLLQYFHSKNIPCFGVEPTNSTGSVAREKGIHTIEEFFGVSLAKRLAGARQNADVIIANNVLAHVPDINDFVSGFATLLNRSGVAIFEFPHLCELIKNCQFDTIYHEHFSYLSFTAVSNIFDSNGLEVIDVEKLPTHGGSLRVYAQRRNSGTREISKNVALLYKEEQQLGISDLGYYSTLQEDANFIAQEFRNFVSLSISKGRSLAGYGAAAKGNTLLNFSEITVDSIPYVVDLNPHKQGCLLPGSHIPVVDESVLSESKPDYIIIFPWNIANEISEQLHYARQWGAKFVTVVPELKIW